MDVLGHGGWTLTERGGVESDMKLLPARKQLLQTGVLFFPTIYLLVGCLFHDEKERHFMCRGGHEGPVNFGNSVTPTYQILVHSVAISV